MANIPRSKVVRETEEYNDLLDVSHTTRRLLKEPKVKQAAARKPKATKKAIEGVSSLKVHLPNKKSADDFAKLLQRPLSSRLKTIRFIGRWNPKTKTVRIITKTTKSKWRFQQHLDEHPRAWLTSRLFLPSDKTQQCCHPSVSGYSACPVRR